MSIYLKKVSKEECDLLFKWANDKETRKNSFNNKEISYEDHVRWLNNKLNSNTGHIFILCNEKTPIGQVRIESENGNAIISYSIDSNYRGKGYASKMLILLEEEVGNKFLFIKKLVGNVKYDNIPSRKIFKKLGYIEMLKDNHMEYYKEIR